MIVDFLLLAVGMTWVLAAAVFDIRTREVPDWLSFSLLSLGLGIRLVYTLVFSVWSFFLYGLVAAGSAVIIGLLFHYSRIWGDGDSKLLVALGAVFATAPFFVAPAIPFFAIVIVNILIFGAAYGLVWALFLFIRNYRKILVEARAIFSSTLYLRSTMIAFAVVSVALIPLMKEVFFRILLLVLAVSFMVYYFLYVMMKSVENIAMHRRIPVAELTVGDWVGETVKVRGRVICSSRDYGLEQRQIDELRRCRVNSVLVKEGMPFVPAFAFGLMFSLIFGNILFLMF